MKVVLALSALVALTFATPFELEPLSDAEIFYINQVAGTWKAGRNFYPHELERVKRMLGVDMEKNAAYNKAHLLYKEVEVRDDLPTEFDPRTKWSNCPSLSEIRDQANCGSCWAFGAAEAMTDRICIKGGGQVHISAEDINDCCRTCGNGCNGGFPTAAWGFYTDEGVVTGGQYGTKQGCMPYSLPHCDHHVTGQYPECQGSTKTPVCHKQCITGYAKTYTQDKQKGTRHYGLRGVEQIMQELVDNGPVTASFNVYSDFPSYKSGVYKHTSGEMLGGHAVKILGYGTESGEDYWLVANSWNTDWGDKGYFKIRRGHDECGIESQMVTGEPRLQ